MVNFLKKKDKFIELDAPGKPVVTVELRPKASARRLSLRVSRLDGRVTMSLPKWTPIREARNFAWEKESWIRQQLAQRPEPVVPIFGSQILFQGHLTPIIQVPKGPARFQDGQFMLPGTPEKSTLRLAALLKELARDRINRACEHYADALGTSYQRISLRDTRSRWGSCSSAGSLMFSWRLIMAPPDVLDYVAAHEVAHLLEMNHSAAYWANVARVCPGYKAPRQWLRQNAAVLHSYQFRN